MIQTDTVTSGDKWVPEIFLIFYMFLEVYGLSAWANLNFDQSHLKNILIIIVFSHFLVV